MSTPPARILIIDNDDGVVAALSARLEVLGYTTITATTGAQGLSEFNEQAVDLVITDVNMPGGDGVQLAESIRQRSDVPIIFITGFHRDFRDGLSRIRNVTVMQKPFDSADLIDLVEAELVMSGCPTV